MTKEEKHKNKLVQNYKEGTSKGTDATEEAVIGLQGGGSRANATPQTGLEGAFWA